MKKLQFLFILFTGLALATSCDKDFDVPPVGGEDPDITVTHTIAQIKALHVVGNNPTKITEDAVIKGVVISNDDAGNFYKQLVIQDETAGIELRLDRVELHAEFPVGRRVFVKLKDLYVGDFNGNYQIGGGLDGEDLLRIPDALIDDVVLKGQYNQFIVPKTVLITELDVLQDQNTLIRLENVEFSSSDAGKTFADAVLEQSVNRDIQDCSNNTIILRTSGFADFADQLTPTGNGTITAIMAVFGSTKQLYVNDPSDIDFTGTRCNGGTGEAQLMTIAELREVFNTGGTAAPADRKIRGIVISDYQNGNTTGRNLYIQDNTAGIVVRFDANHSFPLNEEIEVVVSGETLSEFNELLQVEDVSLSNATSLGAASSPTPREVTVAEILANADEWESTLVKITGVSLSGSSTYSGTLSATDATGNIDLFTRSAASFSGNSVPGGEVTLTAVISPFTTPQLFIRNLNDVEGGTQGGDELFFEDFQSAIDNTNLNLPGWTNVALAGSVVWTEQVFAGNGYAEARVFDTDEDEMIAWLITPDITLDDNYILTFETAQAFWEHDGLSVWIATDFNGSNAASANWVELSATLADGGDDNYDLVPSGNIDLSAYNGQTINVGFRYEGSDQTGSATTFHVDNVKVDK